jgi:hypothetical protein
MEERYKQLPAAAFISHVHAWFLFSDLCYLVCRTIMRYVPRQVTTCTNAITGSKLSLFRLSPKVA